MKRIVLLLTIIGLTKLALAGQIIERHNFFNQYDPTSTMVYDSTNSSATGDQQAVNTYTRKSIQITPIKVNEYIIINIEGRSANQKNTPNWSILDRVEFATASSDIEKQKTIDVTEYVDFLRVGVKNEGTDGASQVDIEGLFTNLER